MRVPRNEPIERMFTSQTEQMLVDSGGGKPEGPGAAETARGLADTERAGADMRNVILAFIRANPRTAGPTTREIAAAVGLKSPGTVHSHLKQLEKDGLVRNLGGHRGYGPA